MGRIIDYSHTLWKLVPNHQPDDFPVRFFVALPDGLTWKFPRQKHEESK